MKPFLSIEKQIELIDSRGMSITENPKAYQFLLRKNYYNTMNVYGKIFLDSNSGKFINGSSFNEIMHCYYFDKDLREITLKMSLEVEANVRSTISHYFCEQNPDHHSYMNPLCFRQTHINAPEEEKFIKSFIYLQEQIDKFFCRAYKPGKQTGTPIEHYMVRYQSIPLWVMINEFTLGDLCTFYSLLDFSLQDKIAKCFSTNLSLEYEIQIALNRKEFLNFLYAIRDLRNRAAHDNTLIFFKTNQNVTFNNFLHPYHGITKREGRQNYYHSMITMQMFLNKSNFLFFEKAIAKKIRNISKKISSVDINYLTSFLGFPTDWHLQERLQNKQPSKKVKP
ncbi:Abi family protein [Erysipelothrix enhydrae]|uniref:Abi family protein n=1 Tax=Erysipelothrix enhydrae TaxID=2890314 RepID=UPI002B24D493|nr:Abi family protein [Erysipelothrix sp. 4322-04]WRB86639.1 Abi family protein [Erysipelothrix sp. 4322-04]